MIPQILSPEQERLLEELYRAHQEAEFAYLAAKQRAREATKAANRLKKQFHHARSAWLQLAELKYGK
jgi:hypothetical protein